MRSSRTNATNRWLRAASAAVIAFAFVLPAAAQWKWRDKSGHTQYSDLPPPPGVPDQDILQRPASGGRSSPAAAPAPEASAPPLAAARASDPELEARRRKAEQDAADKKKAEDAKNAATRADNCSRAREQIRTLDSGVRISRTDEQGERVFLDDAGRAAETRKAQQAIASECR